jgi:hypothetical protein
VSFAYKLRAEFCRYLHSRTLFYFSQLQQIEKRRQSIISHDWTYHFESFQHIVLLFLEGLFRHRMHATEQLLTKLLRSALRCQPLYTLALSFQVILFGDASLSIRLPYLDVSFSIR